VARNLFERATRSGQRAAEKEAADRFELFGLPDTIDFKSTRILVVDPGAKFGFENTLRSKGAEVTVRLSSSPVPFVPDSFDHVFSSVFPKETPSGLEMVEALKEGGEARFVLASEAAVRAAGEALLRRFGNGITFGAAGSKRLLIVNKARIENS